MSGHVFVIQGSLTHLDYDAVIIPTDHYFDVTSGWGEVIGLSAAAAGPVEFDALRPSDWKRTRFGRAQEVAGGTIPLKPTWFVDSAWDDSHDPVEALDAVRARLAATLREIAAAHLSVPIGRTHLLVALPTLGTGAGGFGEIRGAVIDALLATCQAAVEQDVGCDVLLDIVIVASNPANYTAFQARRRELPHHHRHLGSKLEKDARELARLATEGNLALFLGAGVGIAAGLPSWETLLKSLGEMAAGQSGEPDSKDRGQLSDLSSDLDRAELLHRELGVGFGAAVAGLIKGTSRYAITHAMLASLGCGEVVTTNYDQLYEKAARDIQPGGTIATLPFDQPRARTPWVLKMHGDIREPGSIVLTRSDFVSYDAKSRPLGSVVQSLMVTKHLLVVGASMTDDNFLRLAHEVFAFNAEGAVGGGVPHGPIGTVLTLTEQPIKARLWKNRFTYVPLSDEALVADQARDLAVFLDFVALLTAGNEHLIDARFSNLLGSAAELKAAQTARDLAEQIDQLPGAVSGPWNALRHQLGELGAGAHQTSQERRALAAASPATGLEG